VNYESRVTWRQETDLLRCSKSFHGAPRHDFVMVNAGGNDLFFSQLVFIFTYRYQDVLYALALVQPLDATVTDQPETDCSLGLCRIRAQPRKDSRIIPVRAIRRGALVVPDHKRANEHLVIDALDGDMFLRCIDLFPGRDMAAQRGYS
jgi:hypothetical protein